MRLFYPVPPEKMANIAPLFANWDETMIWSCLQNVMGRAWADDPDDPRAARILTGDFCSFAGDSAIPAARALIAEIPKDFPNPDIIMTGKDDAWNALIEEVHLGHCVMEPRYAIRKEPDVFDRERLRGFVGALPGGYRIAPIGEALYHSTRREEWSRDLCSQFPTYADYRARGLGFVALHADKPVCGASSYTVYHGGIEIEIDTVEAHRRKGLATACAAALILECLDRGLYPSWDAANLHSVALAEKLGYHLDHEYAAYEVAIPPKKTE